MENDEIRFWSKVSHKMIKEAQEAVSPLVGQRKAGEIVKMGADGTPTQLIDQVAEEKVIEVLEGVGKPLTLVSEEVGRLEVGEGPSEVILVVDPLDGTSNAVKNIPAYGISVAVAKYSGGSMTTEQIELGFVKNFATGDVYSAIKGLGANLNGEKIFPSLKSDISTASIGAYVHRADMKKMEKLCKKVRRMRTLGSVAIEVCYVADGTYDAFLDVRGNMRIVDISAAQLIVEEAGGLVTDETCQPLNSELNVVDRTSIIVSGNQNIHHEIMNILGGI
jgi:myo-inositol-1(or 4)-monophosphatase